MGRLNETHLSFIPSNSPYLDCCQAGPKNLLSMCSTDIMMVCPVSKRNKMLMGGNCVTVITKIINKLSDSKNTKATIGLS